MELEDLNQNLENEESLFDDVDEVEEESLFDDQEDEETVEETEEPEGTPTEGKEEETTEEEPFMVVRYNKEDKKLSREEAITMAQKGMNYDKVHGQYNGLFNQINGLAQMNGMDVESYLNSLNEMQVNYAVEQELKSLKQKYPNSDDELLREIANKHVNERLEQNKAQVAQSQNSEVEMQQKEIERQVSIFEKRYPDVDLQKLDQEVFNLVDEGYTLLEAYQIHLENQRKANEKVKEKNQEIKRINEKNKKKSFGNIGTNESSNSDDFISGFMG